MRAVIHQSLPFGFVILYNPFVYLSRLIWSLSNSLKISNTFNLCCLRLPHGSLVLTMQSYDCLRTQQSKAAVFFIIHFHFWCKSIQLCSHTLSEAILWSILKQNGQSWLIQVIIIVHCLWISNLKNAYIHYYSYIHSPHFCASPPLAGALLAEWLAW